MTSAVSTRTAVWPRRLALSAVALAGATLLSACVVTPVGPVQGYAPAPIGGNVPDGAQPDPLYVQSMPPAPIYEVQPAMPFVGAVWIGGGYYWSNNAWIWGPGRWVSPRPGYQWRAPYYAPRVGGGAVYVPGHWGSANRPFVAPSRSFDRRRR